MTHLCEVITFPARGGIAPGNHPRRPNHEALAHLHAADDLVEAVKADIEAGITNAAAGTSTLALGGLSKGRTLGWSVRATLELAALTNDPRDRELAAYLQEWLKQKASTDG